MSASTVKGGHMLAHDHQAAHGASERGQPAESERGNTRMCANPPCRTLFEPNAPHQKHCSDNCRRRHFDHREDQRQGEFVAEHLITPERVAEALREYRRRKKAGGSRN